LIYLIEYAKSLKFGRTHINKNILCRKKKMKDKEEDYVDRGEKKEEREIWKKRIGMR